MSSEYVHPQGPSALMAIIVDAVALVYLVYITFDEYTSKPLGLRSPSAKARLILLDIFFIVFDSANLSLAFESLSTVRGSCTFAEVNQEITPKNDAICDRQKALASVLLIALVAWLTTFAISVLRYAFPSHKTCIVSDSPPQTGSSRGLLQREAIDLKSRIACDFVASISLLFLSYFVYI